MRLRNCFCLVFLFASEVHASEVETEQAEAAAAIIETCFEEMRPPSWFEAPSTFVSTILNSTRSEYNPIALQETIENLGLEAVEPPDFDEFLKTMFLVELTGNAMFLPYLTTDDGLIRPEQLNSARQWSLRTLETSSRITFPYQSVNGLLVRWQPAAAYWAAQRVPFSPGTDLFSGGELTSCNLAAPAHSTVYAALNITPETSWAILDQRDVYTAQFGSPTAPHTALTVIRLHPEFAEEQGAFPLQIVITRRGY